MQNYTYKARVTRVLDGDTIDTVVSLGFNVNMDIRFRLEGFDAPETYRPKSPEEKALGLLATEALVDFIGDKEVLIVSTKHGKYRWLGTVYSLEDTKVSVNQKMIDLGHVKTV